MTTDILRRSPISGHGHRARQLQSANIATRLSNYSAVAAALFSTASVKRDLDLAKLDLLIQRTREFAEVIEGLQVHDPSSAKTYRELVPFEVWHSGTTRVEIEANLAGRIRILLDQLSAGTVDVKELQIESERFDHLAEVFRDLGRELVIRSTDQPETS